MSASMPGTPRLDRQQVPMQQMSTEELRREYVQLMGTQFCLRAEEERVNSKIEKLREEAVRLQQSAEVEEEHAANQLLRRLEGAERDVRKYELLLKEEDCATKKLKDQIQEVRGQQADIENQLEQQQEYILLQLQKKVLDVTKKKNELEREIIAERKRYLDLLASQLELFRRAESSDSGATSPAAPAVDASMRSSTSAHIQDTPPSEAAAATITATTTAAAAAQADTASARSTSILSTSHGSTSTDQLITQLEQRLNKLLQDHAAATQFSADTERRCDELIERLHSVQSAACTDRARAAELKEDLRQAKSRLADTTSATFDESMIGRDSFYDEGTLGSTPSRSLEQSSSSIISVPYSATLRDRTKELLSLAPPPTAHPGTN